MSISAKDVSFDDDSMRVDLSDGRTISVPLAWFPRLLNATRDQREKVEIGRSGLHWPELDEDISIAGLLAGRRDQTTDVKTAVRFKLVTASGREAEGDGIRRIGVDRHQSSAAESRGRDMKQPGLDHRHRDQSGEIRRKNSNTLVRTLREEYGPGFAKGYRPDTQLGTVL
jgi:hypothetical protein